MYRILIVEDDSTIASNVAAHLERWDYETKQIEDFKCVMEAFQQFDPQLVILDIGLPFYNGFYWCQEIRKISSVPILFLSSMNDNMNIVMAMNMGGDEFIEKPFDLNVLTAKVQALLRRAYSFQGLSLIHICNLQKSTVRMDRIFQEKVVHEIKLLEGRGLSRQLHFTNVKLSEGNAKKRDFRHWSDSGREWREVIIEARCV